MQLNPIKKTGRSLYPAKLIKCIAILFICGLTVFLLIEKFWAAQVYLAHTAVELISIFLLLAAFVDTWHTYDDVSDLNRILGFSFLIIAILNSFHVLLFIKLISFGANNVDTSMKFWYSGGLFEITLLYIVSSYKTRINVSKWMGLLMSIAICILIGFAVYLVSFLVPDLYDAKGITKTKHIIDIILFAAAIAVTLKIHARLKDKEAGNNEKTIMKYTYLAVIIFVFARVCFVFSSDVDSTAYAFGHVLRVVYSFLLYSAVYITTVKFPYVELKEIVEENRIIINSATIGMVSFDDSDRINLVNSQSEMLLNTTQTELVGVGYKDFVEKFLKLSLDDICKLNLVENKGDSCEYTCVCNTGKEAAFKMTVTIIFMKHRKFMILRDAKKQQALENLQLQTQTILNAMESPVLVMDPDGRIIMCNRNFEHLVEMPAVEVIGKTVVEMDDMVQLKITKPSDVKRLRDCYIGSLEADLTTPSGKQRRVIINSAPIKNVDEEIIGFISVTPDITDMKNEQERMQQQEKLALIGNMAAGLVHEIKNPLASIKGFIQMVKQKTADDKIREYSEIIESASEDINKIVTDFLMFAKPLPVKMQDISLNRLVKSLEIIIGSNAFKNGVACSFSYAEKEKHVYADERQIKQVVLNMVDNALYAMNGIEKPILKLSTDYNDGTDEMTICISDNGTGMSAEQLSKVGTPFYTTKEKGTGLGISICNHIINEHGGSIAIQSRCCKGTTFTIKLPRSYTHE